jgi:multidrug efflux system outer membrane protein
MKLIQFPVWCVLLVLLSGGCMVGPKYSRPVIDAPVSYSEVSDLDTLPLVKWFDLFHDTVLQQMIHVTLQNNRDLLTATARIDEARYNVGIARANIYPSFNYGVTGGGGHAGSEAQKIAAGYNSGYLNAGAQLNWEIDLWGRLHRAKRASQEQFLSEVDNRNAILTSLVAQVATTYFLLLDLDNQLHISQKTLESRSERTKINTARFEKGYSSEIDMLQAQQQEAVAAASTADLQRQIISVENGLRLLMGMNPGHITRGDSLYHQLLPPDIPTGLPSQLLQRRPDIRAAEEALQAQFEQIGIAQANLFPTLSLTGILGFASPQLSSLISSNGFVANGFAGVTGPIFQFSKNKLLVGATKERTKQVAFQYEQTVLVAMGEVDNGLADARNLAIEHNYLQQQVEASEKALELTIARYDFGYSSYTEVLIEENFLFSAELQESSVYQQRLAAIVNLYRALGGGWDVTPN